MKKLFQLLTLLLLISGGLSNAFANAFSRVPKPRPTDPKIIIPNLIAEKQQTKMWCWAASSRMLLSSVSQNIPTQCEMASILVKEDCCANPGAIKCVKPQYISAALDKLGYEVKVTFAKTNPNEHWSKRTDYKGWYQSVVDSIKKGSPVIISRYNGAGTANISAHAVVAYGTYNRDGIDYLLIFDPWEGITKFWDSSYVTGYMAWIETTTLKR
jgi:hypothetical protein